MSLGAVLYHAVPVVTVISGHLVHLPGCSMLRNHSTSQFHEGCQSMTQARCSKNLFAAYPSVSQAGNASEAPLAIADLAMLG